MSTDYPNFDQTRPCFGQHSIFTPDKPTKETVKEAKAICNSCDFLKVCREYALGHKVYGVWGAMTQEERRAATNGRAVEIPRQRIRVSRPTA